MSRSPAVSIITAVYNRLDLTKSYLLDLKHTLPSLNHEIILVDDGSTDGTREYLSSLQKPHLKLILNEKNLGFAGANNRGAKNAQAPVLVFLNNDLVLSKGWLEPMLHIAQEPNCGMVGNVQVNAVHGRIDHAGIVFTPWGIPQHYGMDYLYLPKRGCKDFRAVTAACCLVKKDIFTKAGGFDESFRNGFEDIDLCLRLGNMGYQNKVALSSRVGHWVSSSPGRKDKDDPNRELFLHRWGAIASEWGKRDWPRHYLLRHLRYPWKLNGTKTLDALIRLFQPDRKLSAWMQKKIGKSYHA